MLIVCILTLAVPLLLVSAADFALTVRETALSLSATFKKPFLVIKVSAEAAPLTLQIAFCEGL